MTVGEYRFLKERNKSQISNIDGQEHLFFNSSKSEICLNYQVLIRQQPLKHYKELLNFFQPSYKSVLLCIDTRMKSWHNDKLIFIGM